MSRIQRLGIGNGGVDCQISYMQGKKYPNATEKVDFVGGVTNKTLLKNPYNTLNEPIAVQDNAHYGLQRIIEEMYLHVAKLY